MHATTDIGLRHGSQSPIRAAHPLLQIESNGMGPMRIGAGGFTPLRLLVDSTVPSSTEPFAQVASSRPFHCVALPLLSAQRQPNLDASTGDTAQLSALDAECMAIATSSICHESDQLSGLLNQLHMLVHAPTHRPPTLCPAPAMRRHHLSKLGFNTGSPFTPAPRMSPQEVRNTKRADNKQRKDQ